MDKQLIQVEVIYASPDRQAIKALQIPYGSSVQQAIDLSGILDDCPEINLQSNKVGIFSQFCALEDVLQNEDRVEIYRPLLQDPKDARRERASKTMPRRK